MCCSFLFSLRQGTSARPVRAGLLGGGAGGEEGRGRGRAD